MRGEADGITVAVETKTLTTEVAGLSVHMLEGGSGNPAVVLHHSTGPIGWIPLHDELSRMFRVLVTDIPGFGQSDRPAWAREPRDLAMLLNRTLDRLGLEGVTLIGAGFGGFVAAEMAAMTDARLRSLVLIGAAGIQPEQGEIMDQMVLKEEFYVQKSFRDEASFQEFYGEDETGELADLWDFSREMTARVTWRPYMFDRRLPHLLATVQTPTLLVWGSEDQVVPVNTGELYAKALPNAQLEIVPGAGHVVEYEEPETVTRLIAEHVGSHA